MDDIRNKAEVMRKHLGEDTSSPIDIFSAAQNIPKLTVVFFPLGQNISGICRKLSDEEKIIIINSSMSLGRQRFSMAHEFYHLFFDPNMDMSVISTTNIGTGDDTERAADAFASYFLIPSNTLYEKVSKKERLDIRDIIELEQFFGTSHQAMLIRLCKDGYITQKEIDRFPSNITSLAASYGFDVSLYKPSEKEKSMLVLGSYISKAKDLFDSEKISLGKYEELLLDAFRADIVYGENEGSISND